MCLAFVGICYFVLPPVIGVGAVVLAAALPWYEEQLKRRIEKEKGIDG